MNKVVEAFGGIGGTISSSIDVLVRNPEPKIRFIGAAFALTGAYEVGEGNTIEGLSVLAVGVAMFKMPVDPALSERDPGQQG